MFSRTTLLCVTFVIAVNSQPQGPFFSYSSGGPSSSSPPQYSGGFPPSPFGKGSGLSSSPFSSGGPSSSSLFSSGGPPPSHFGGGGPPSNSPFSGGPPGRPGRPKSGNKLFSWIGSTMSKLQGLGPKLHYYPPKQKPSSIGLSSLSPSAQNAPPSYFSSGGPPRESLVLPPSLNSIFEGSSSPLFEGGSTVTYASPSHPNSIEHPPVNFRNPSGPPPPRPGPPPPRFGLSRPPFGSRPPQSFSSGSSQFAPSRPSFGGSPYSRPPPQHTRNNLEVFPSQQVSYQSETLENEPGFDGSFGSLQNLYKSQSNTRPSYFQNQQGPSNYEQQSSFSQNKPQVSKNSGANYGATFHSIEPVRVAPIYDVGENFKPSAADLSGAPSQVHNNQQQQQQPASIHDTSFAALVNDYAAQTDAATSGSEQMIAGLQGSQDMVTAASTHQAIPGMQILGQGSSPDGNPIFEVLADANAPTYDGHPVDLNKLISMIEPGAQIDTMPAYNSDTDLGASEHHPVYAQPPSNLELESDAAMASGIMSGNKPVASEKSQIQLHSQKIRFNNIYDKLQAVASSESRPTVVKPDGTRLDDEKLIKEHFDKEIILDDLQENKDRGFIIVGIHTDDNDTGDQNEDVHLHGTQKNWTLNDSFDSNNNNTNYKDDMLAIVQQLRNSAFSAVVEKVKTGSGGSFIPNSNMTDSPYLEENTKTTQHPNHNYYPELSPTLLEITEDKESETRENLPVINPIFDSVRQSRLSEMDSENDTSLADFQSDKVQDNLQQPTEDIDDGDDNFPGADDLIMSDDDGDLAASGSRNVKSVAIIVTPPPNYVKIRNKYKKPITPLSAATSSTTPLSAIPSNNSSESLKSSNNNDFSISAANNSRDNQNINDKESSISSTTTTTAASVITSTSLPSNQPKSSSSSSSNDSILNISTTRSDGIDIGHFINNSSDNSNRPQTENKQTRRYPVYRGRNSSNNNA